jgi:class 3 adenylate cyclase
MSWSETLSEEVETILDTKWDVRDGNVVPESADVTITDGAVKIEGAFLYADLAGSSVLAKLCPWETTAKVIRAYLDCCTRLIRAYGGEIRSFDGDRVMAIFKGDTPNNDAARCAREIDWVVEKVLNPKAKQKFTSISKNNLEIRHCIGIDTGTAVAVRAGIRNNNDLIWIGRASSLAAKLSDIRSYPYAVYITKECYDKLTTSNKMSDDVPIWETATIKISGEDYAAYRTKYIVEP